MVDGNKLILSGSAFLAGASISWEKHVLTKKQSVRVSVPSRGVFLGNHVLKRINLMSDFEENLGTDLEFMDGSIWGKFGSIWCPLVAHLGPIWGPVWGPC